LEKEISDRGGGGVKRNVFLWSGVDAVKKFRHNRAKKGRSGEKQENGG